MNTPSPRQNYEGSLFRHRLGKNYHLLHCFWTSSLACSWLPQKILEVPKKDSDQDVSKPRNLNACLDCLSILSVQCVTNIRIFEHIWIFVNEYIHSYQYSLDLKVPNIRTFIGWILWQWIHSDIYSLSSSSTNIYKLIENFQFAWPNLSFNKKHQKFNIFSKL